MIAVIGASGRTGRLVAHQAAARGHPVTAVVRNATRFDPSAAARVAVAESTDAAQLAPVIAGCDAVLFCIGPVPGESTVIQQDSIAAALEAMGPTGVRRIVAISASGGVVDGDDPLSRYVAKPILARVLRDSNADTAAMEERLRESDAAWTILRPPRLTDKPATGRYRQRRDGNVRWHYLMRRSHLAQAMLDALHDDSSIHQTIAVTD
ncbi:MULTISPECIES: SDR family oxidoreductase [unclassified Microbacterium]|uniref:NAD(P)-dependent oxidoreductase n=1 Tax=unclassified Microbacterium TaxID=2609290 RepID=UPI00214B8A55|nr:MULTISPECIES: SDR family oxidoreductase [unclassified Microbacterium]MCR2783533.1 SDR family oxidoreductase [Microbacterium sp. zg.B96]WIM15606.1 SDR family oxidoreductase [Microbacterium sp. zg-B96]